jgi:hypothetical protein
MRAFDQGTRSRKHCPPVQHSTTMRPEAVGKSLYLAASGTKSSVGGAVITTVKGIALHACKHAHILQGQECASHLGVQHQHTYLQECPAMLLEMTPG